MKVTFLNAMRKSESNQKMISSLMEEINNYTIDLVVFHLDQVDLAACDFCLDCWTKHPERCKFSDDGRDIIDQLWSSDLLVYFTDIERKVRKLGDSTSKNEENSGELIDYDSRDDETGFDYILSESLERLLLRTIPYKRYPKLLVVGVYEGEAERDNDKAKDNDGSENIRSESQAEDTTFSSSWGASFAAEDSNDNSDLREQEFTQVRQALAKRVERIRVDYHYRQTRQVLIHPGHNQIDRTFLLQEAFENFI